VSIPELLDCERLDLVAALAALAAEAAEAALASLRLLRSTFKILDKMSPFFSAISFNLEDISIFICCYSIKDLGNISYLMCKNNK
jgi:hypothetical protein